jgi:hypothetical protein
VCGCDERLKTKTEGSTRHGSVTTSERILTHLDFRWTENKSMKGCLFPPEGENRVKMSLQTNSECRSDERLKTKVEESTRLSDTGLFGELEHLKI